MKTGMSPEEKDQMAKTRRKKMNKSPGKPFRNSRAHVVDKGDRVTVQGARGRTEVKRVTDETGKRLTTARLVESVPQVAAKSVGAHHKPTPIFVGRVYTGVARSKPYPYNSKKRGMGAPGFVPTPLTSTPGGF